MTFVKIENEPDTDLGVSVTNSSNLPSLDITYFAPEFVGNSTTVETEGSLLVRGGTGLSSEQQKYFLEALPDKLEFLKKVTGLDDISVSKDGDAVRINLKGNDRPDVIPLLLNTARQHGIISENDVTHLVETMQEQGVISPQLHNAVNNRLLIDPDNPHMDPRFVISASKIEEVAAALQGSGVESRDIADGEVPTAKHARGGSTNTGQGRFTNR